MSVISAKNLNFSYSAQKKVIDDISFEIARGSYTAIIGSNGSGKSTLARIICGLLNQDSGQLEIDKDARIGLVFQSPKDQVVSGIVSRDTAFGPQNLGLSQAEVELRTIECLNIVDLLEKAQASTSALSLGQTQKTALSGMIAIWPEILILDEAVAMIDPDTRSNIFDFLRYWHKEGNTIIHITHDMEAIREAESVIMLEKGKILYTGSCFDFFNNDELVEKIQGPRLKKIQTSTAEESLDSEQNAAVKTKKTETTLTFSHVSFKYSKDDEERTLKDISFALHRGELVALTGASGAGKSTLMELACGLLTQSEGEIRSISKPLIAQQNCSAALFESFAADDVAFGPRNQGYKGKDLKEKVVSAMNKVNLPYDEFGDRQTFYLSGGEQRRLAIAGIIAMDGDVLFFDEPSAGLDGISRFEVISMLKSLAMEGKTVVFSTHKNDEAYFADREINIEKGSLRMDSAAFETSFDGTAASGASVSVDSSVSSDSSENQKLIIQPRYDFESTLNNLRNVSLSLSGAKSRNKSLLEKLPPFLRIIIFLLFFVFSLSARNIYLSTSALILAIFYCVITGFKLKRLALAALKILPFLLIFSLFQLIFRPPLADEIQFTSWKWFCITPSKLLFCLSSILKTDAALACISAFFVSTPDYDLIDGLKVLLKPLTLIKIPVHYFILIMEIIFRFTPLLMEECSSIIKTQIIRGGFGKVKGKIAKIKALIPLIVPLIIQTIKRSEALADAITMRCFK